MNNILEPFRSTFVCSNAEDLQLSIKENVLCYENSKREISSQNNNARGILLIQIVDEMDIEQEEQMKMIFTDSAEEIVMIEEDTNDSNEDVIITKEDKDIFNKNGIIEDNNNDDERFDIEIPFDIQRYKLIDI